jgi:glycosyltransferase involved in cell wall biosynthesis
MAEPGAKGMRVTLVTSAHVANNPRLVKEADALVDAGHAVRVVSPRQHAPLVARDAALLATRSWRIRYVNVDPTTREGAIRRLVGVARERAARTAFALGLRTPGIAAQALSRYVRPLARAAAEHPADLLVAHNLQALPAAAMAARALGAHLGFDAEDLHAGEFPDDAAHAAQRALVEFVEAHLLPRCDRLTASSAGIARELAARYGVAMPTVIHNVFPAAEREIPVARGDERPADARVSLYWYSQVIGGRRGVEEAIEALASLPGDVHLTLRGEVDAAFADTLRALLERHRVADRVHVRATAAPHELVARAAWHDVGLALEQPQTRNRDLCVTNKLFTYLLAGLAVAATDTQGQREIMAAAPGAGFLCAPGDAGDLARGLRTFVDDPAALRAARDSARRIADGAFSWDREREVLVRHLTGTTAAEPRASCASC